MAEVVLGLRTPTSGAVRLGDQDITHLNPRQSLDAGIGFVPEDRMTDGIIASFSIADNLVLDQFTSSQFSAFGSRKLAAIALRRNRRSTTFA